jgi:hypothetical protein
MLLSRLISQIPVSDDLSCLMLSTNDILELMFFTDLIGYGAVVDSQSSIDP